MHTASLTLSQLQCSAIAKDMHSRPHTCVTHCLIGNKAIFSKHFIGWSTAVKANTRAVGHDHNLVVAAEEQEQAHTSHMTNM